MELNIHTKPVTATALTRVAFGDARVTPGGVGVRVARLYPRVVPGDDKIVCGHWGLTLSGSRVCVP